MNGTDFITAFGRLLHDGRLRDHFAADPFTVAAKLGLGERDGATLRRVAPSDLECQARVLLRKRFDKVRRVLPETCERLGEKSWMVFQEYARTHWHRETELAARDALDFCEYLKKRQPAALCDFEWNRLRFAFGEKRFALHCVNGLAIRNKPRRALQLFVRGRFGRWRELALYVGF